MKNTWPQIVIEDLMTSHKKDIRNLVFRGYSVILLISLYNKAIEAHNTGEIETLCVQTAESGGYVMGTLKDAFPKAYSLHPELGKRAASADKSKSDYKEEDIEGFLCSVQRHLKYIIDII